MPPKKQPNDAPDWLKPKDNNNSNNNDSNSNDNNHQASGPQAPSWLAESGSIKNATHASPEAQGSNKPSWLDTAPKKEKETQSKPEPSWLSSLKEPAKNPKTEEPKKTEPLVTPEKPSWLQKEESHTENAPLSPSPRVQRSQTSPRPQASSPRQTSAPTLEAPLTSSEPVLPTLPVPPPKEAPAAKSQNKTQSLRDAIQEQRQKKKAERQLKLSHAPWESDNASQLSQDSDALSNQIGNSEEPPDSARPSSPPPNVHVPSSVTLITAGAQPKAQIVFRNWGLTRSSKPKRKVSTISSKSRVRRDDNEMYNDYHDGSESEHSDNDEQEALHEGIFKNIFSRLGPRDLAHVRLVCTEWKKAAEEAWRRTLEQNKDEIKRRQQQAVLKKTEENLKAQVMVSSRDIQSLSTQTRDLFWKSGPANTEEEKNFRNFQGTVDSLLEDIADYWRKLEDSGVLKKTKADNMANAVSSELANLIGQAKEFALSSKDPLRRQRLLNVLGELEQVMPTMYQAVKDAGSNPDDKNYQSKLSQAISTFQEMMSKATKNANAEEKAALDASKVQTSLDELLALLGTFGDASKLTRELHDAIKKQVALGTDALSATTDPEQKQIMIDSIGTLETSARRLNNVAKTAFKDPDNKGAKKKLGNLLKQVKDANYKLEKENPLNQKLATNGRGLSSALEKLQDLSKNLGQGALNPEDEVRKLLKDFVNKLAKQSALGEEFGKLQSDILLKTKFMETSKEMGDLKNGIMMSVENVLKNSQDEASRKKLVHLLSQVENLNNILEKEGKSNKNLILHGKNLMQAQQKLKKMLENFLTADNPDELAKLLTQLIIDQARCADDISNLVNDPKQKEATKEISIKMQSLAPDIHTSTKGAFDDINNRAARDKLSTLLAAVKNENNRLSKRHPGNRKVITNFQEIESATNALTSLLNDKIESSKLGEDALDMIVDHLIKQVTLGREAAGRCKDPTHRQKILNACDELESFIPEVINAIKTALANPEDATVQNNLQKVLTHAKELSEKLRSLIPDDLELDSSIKHLGISLDNLLNAIRNIAGAGAKTKELREQLMKQLNAGKKAVKSVPDSPAKIELSTAVTKLEKLVPIILKSAADDLAKMTQALQDEIILEPSSKLLYQSDLAKDLLSALPPPAKPEEEIIKIMTDGKTSNTAIDEAVKEVVNQIVKRVELGREIAIKIKDKQLRQQVINATQKLEDLIGPVAQAVRNAFAEPNNRILQQRLTALMDKVAELSAQLDKLIPAETNILANGQMLEGFLNRLLNTFQEESGKKAPSQQNADEEFLKENEEEETHIPDLDPSKFIAPDVQPKETDINTLSQQQIESMNPELLEGGTIPAFFNLFDFEFLNTNIFNSDFFLLEIARLKTKYEYDNERRITGDIRRQQNIKNPKTTDELLRISEREEVFATQFAEKLEYEWARMLIKQAILIRMQVFNAYAQAETSDDEKQKQLFQMEKNWEKYIFLCLKGQPANDDSEHGVEKTLELLESAADLAPVHLRDARCAQYVNLWEARVKFGLQLYQKIYEREGMIDAVINNHITPLLKNVPHYLDRNNIVLAHLWNAIAKVHEEVATMNIIHGIPHYKEYLLELHAFYHQKMSEEDIVSSVYETFPLFTDIDMTLCAIYLKEEDWASAQEFAVEEMMIYLEMDEETQNNDAILTAWGRIFKCIKKMNPKSSDQFYLLKDVSQEISVYNNNFLKSQIYDDMKSVGNQKEVKYIISYEQQLEKCCRLYFGDMYEEIAEKLDPQSMLEDLLANLHATEDTDFTLIAELRKLADLNHDFQFYVMKTKDYTRAKKIIEENLHIKKFTDPPSLTESGISLDEKTLASFELLVDCGLALAQKAQKSTMAIHLLTHCYEQRPLFMPYGNEKIKKLWSEMIKLKEFYQETMESFYKKFSSDKKKLLESNILSKQNSGEVNGWMVMRINKTWQKRWFVLQDQILYFYKSPKSLRARGVIPLKDLVVDPEMANDDFLRMVPQGMQDNCFIMATPWRGYIVYTETAEARSNWKRAIEERIAMLSEDEPDHLVAEILINKEVFARHPVILDVLFALASIWEGQEHVDEALILYALGLELAAFMDNTENIRRFWNCIYDILVKNKNIYEILEFLEEENDRWTAYGLKSDHQLLQAIQESLKKIVDEEDLKLRYMYQIRKYKEVTEEIVPARIYHLNQIYTLMFLNNRSIKEAISLTKDSLELLKRYLLANSSKKDDLVHYYHKSTWNQLIDLYIMYSKEREAVGDFLGGRVLLQSAFSDYPEGLDPFNEFLNKVIDEIMRLYSIDPETTPSGGAPVTDSASFLWMHKLYLDYDAQLSKVYPSEAITNRNPIVNFRRSPDKDTLHKRADDFKMLVKKNPYIMNITNKLGNSYYVAHQLENALHMARHTLHIMIASMPNRHKEIDYQWKICKRYFKKQRHSNAEVKIFIEEEKMFASVFLSERHPHAKRVASDLKRLESKIALYEKWIPAGCWYASYVAIIALILWRVHSWEQWLSVVQWFSDITRIWLFVAALSLDLGMLLVAFLFIQWPPLPIDTLHRTAILIKRRRLVKNLALLIACHNSAEVLPQTLRAALRIFPPDHIYVGDNGNSPKPIDDTEEVCGKISQEYHIQHNLPLDSPKINYFWMPEGNKSLVFWYGSKYYVHFKYVMVIDDDVQLPPDLIIPMKKFKIPGTKVLAFTLGVENLYDHHGKEVIVCFWQDLEYKIAGFMKIFQSWIGSAIMAHGAISIWERATLLEVLWRHDTVFHGDDLQMGLILQKLGREYRIDTCGNVNVPTTVPDHIICPSRPWSLYCKCPGKDGNLLGQRVRSWDVASHRFLGKFFTIIFLHWNRTTNCIKPFLIYELWNIFQDWLRIPLSVTLFFANPVGFLQVNLLFVSIAGFLMFLFNYWVLRRRPDQQHPIKSFLSFPFYKLLTMVFRFFALWYNFLFYTPLIRNRQILGTRQDLPLGPEQINMIQKITKEMDEKNSGLKAPPSATHDWDTISKLVNKDAVKTPPLSHWFLSCITKLTGKKDNPRDRILAASFMKKPKKIIGRTERFFYNKTKVMGQIVPETFLTCLNAMCFLSRKSRCFGKDSNRAARIMKWLWLEERLGESIKNQEHLQQAMMEFALQCNKGVSMFQFVALVKEVMKPTLRFLDTSPQILTANILHLQMVHEDGQWSLKSLSLTSTDDRLIIRQFQPHHLKKLLDAKQPLVFFIPVPSSDEVIVEPFKPSIVHTAVFCDPIESTLILHCGSEKMMERMFAVMFLLEHATFKDFRDMYLMSPTTNAVRKVSWHDVESKATNFFGGGHYRIQSNPQAFVDDPNEVEKVEKQIKAIFQADERARIKRTFITTSGFWFMPVIDTIDGPIIFLDEEDNIIDDEVYFIPYGAVLDTSHQIMTRPMSALKKKIVTSTAGAKFLGALSPSTQNYKNTTGLSVSVFKVSGMDKEIQVVNGLMSWEVKLLHIPLDTPTQMILVDFLYLSYYKKKSQESAARKVLAKWRLKNNPFAKFTQKTINNPAANTTSAKPVTKTSGNDPTNAAAKPTRGNEMFKALVRRAMQTKKA